MCGDDVFDFGQIRREIDAVLPFHGGEAHVDHPLQKRFHIVVESVEIVEDARLGQLVQADLRHHLADFLQCARAAGEGDEHVAQFDHARAAFCDIRHDGQFG